MLYLKFLIGYLALAQTNNNSEVSMGGIKNKLNKLSNKTIPPVRLTSDIPH